jgi:peptidoglycan-associated lipoprotein
MNRSLYRWLLTRCCWVILIASLAMILGPLGCSRAKPRERWWQLWRPKATETAQVYNPDTVILPPPPEVLDPNAPGASQPLGVEVPPPPVTGDGTDLPETEPIREKPAGVVSALQIVHFDYDSDAIKPEAQAILDANAAWMLQYPNYEIQIQGHCDERGSVEYNLNLGQRRAKAVMAYLVAKGVSAERLHTISYGEEQPLDPRHVEEAWAKNRRAQFFVY